MATADYLGPGKTSHSDEVEMKHDAIHQNLLMAFVRALAQNQARLEAKAGVRVEMPNGPAADFSPDEFAAVRAHMDLALEMTRGK